MDIYREEILDHFKNPRNYRKVKDSSAETEERNASCGDVIKMEVKVKKGKLKEIGFSGEGCAISIAATSMLTEMVKGKKVEEIRKINEREMIKRLGIKISGGRKKCAILGLTVLEKLLKERSD